MANLYRLKSRTVWDPQNYVKEEVSLVDFLGSSFGRSVEGAIFLGKGTQEWQEHIDAQRKLLESRKDYPLTPEQVQKFIDDLSHSEFLHAKSTDFWGLSYEKAGISRRLLSDIDAQKIVCEISYQHKRIDISRGSYGAMNTIGDQFYKTIEQIYYDGALREALEEFRDQGFAFTLWDTSWGRDTSKLTPIEKASIDDIIRFASQKQK